MKQHFKSKLEPAILLPVSLVLFILIILSVVESLWVPAGALFIAGRFLVYVCRSTCYQITGGRLVIQVGILYRNAVHIRTIKRVRTTRNLSLAPALAFDRLEISFNRYGRVLVSPDEQAEFISELVKANPKIRVIHETVSSKKLKAIPDLF